MYLSACQKQYAGIITSDSIFTGTGSSDNPAGFASCLAMGFPFCLFLTGQQSWKRYLGIGSVFVIGTGIVLSESRSGIISIFCLTVLFVWHKYRNYIKEKRKFIIPVFSALFLVLLITLFLLKKDSASGRVLIWQVSARLIGDNPVSGSGSGSFRSNYMPCQADYFSNNPGSVFSALADNVKHPFNEYIFLTVEYGLTGLVLCLTAAGIAITCNRKKPTPYLFCVYTIIIFSCFSYPFRYPFVWICLLYSLSRLSKNSPPLYSLKLNLSRPIRLVSVLFIMAYSSLLIGHIRFEYTWKRVLNFSLSDETEQMLPGYRDLYSNWNGNPLFIYNYGAELNYIERHAESAGILHECEKYFNDYDLQMLLGNNYFNLKNWERAEKHYKSASDMCPGRFMPLYHLAKIYEKTEQTAKFETISKKILEKPVKIQSPMITRIKYDIENGNPLNEEEEL